MSAEASEEVGKGAAKGEAVEKAAIPVEEPGPQIESQTDRFETHLTYTPDAKLPTAVVLVWVCALIGLGTYAASLYFPDLALWRQ